MKKFYTLVDVHPKDSGYEVRLDARALKTPLQQPLLLPTGALAEAVAKEWREQGDTVVPASMPLTQLANTMVDKGKGNDRQAMNQQMLQYAGADLLCYRAAHPVLLCAMQEEAWMPLLAWAQQAHGIVLHTTTSMRHIAQPEESLRRVEALVESLPPEKFVVLQAAAGLTGSFVIALGLAEGELSAETAYRAACVDELHQAEAWGEDAEVTARLQGMQDELQALARFASLVKASS